MKRIVRCLSVLAAALSLAACELPSEGPGRADIQNTAYSNENTAGFVLVDVNREVADYLRVKPQPGFGERLGRGRPVRADRIGVGDILLVRIWEADPAGLFASAGLVDRGEIPAVEVDATGMISIPYAGDIQAVGRTPREVADAIVERLQDKAVEPQAHVTRVENVANVVTVTGAVKNPGIYPLTMRGDTLLDAVAAAGGAVEPSYETLVSLTRDGRTATTYLEQVLDAPQENIFLQSRDEIHLELRPKTFTALGAMEQKGVHEFEAADLSVLEAVGKVRGLVDNRSDPEGIFLMRFEPATTSYQLVGQENPGDPRQVVPTVYRFDLDDPNQYFFAQVISLRDKDILYVANARSVETSKVLAMFRGAIGAASLATNFGRTAITLGE
jgi:polysaccharide export outer membrane protein